VVGGRSGARAVFAILLALLFLLLWGVDRHFKRWPDRGPLPPGAIQFHSENFPALWRTLRDGSTGAIVASELRRPLHNLELSVRLATGIRPTPLRWQLYLGGPVRLGADASGMAMCMRPGLIVRAFWPLFSASALPHRWEGGYLLLASDAQRLDAFQASRPAARPELPRLVPAFTVQFPQAGDARFSVDAAPGLPFSLELPWQGEMSPVLLPAVQRDAVFSIAAATPELAEFLLRGAASLLGREFPRIAAFEGTMTDLARAYAWIQPGERLPGMAGPVRIDCPAVAVPDVVPVPLMTWVAARDPDAPGEHPWLQGVPAGVARVPMVWGEVSGALLPVLGRDYTLCVARQGDFWLAASNESAMAALAGRSQEAGGPPGLLEASLDWQAAATMVNSVLQRLATLGVLPEAGPREYDQVYGGWVRVFQGLGRMEFSGAPAGAGRLLISGHLAREIAP